MGVAIQFILLMLVLNIVLYTPLLAIIEERKEFILKNLAKASEMLAEANKLETQYKFELNNVRKETQLEITNSQKIYNDKFLNNLTNDLQENKNKILNNLDSIVQSLC